MLTAVIIDNEISCIESLKHVLEQSCPDVRLLGTWMEVNDGIQGIRTSQPDVVFLDVELNDGKTGFDVLEKIPERNFEVIFVTGYNKYAVRAFQFSAVHYLEKPVDSVLLREAIERVKRKRSENDFRMQWKVLSQNLKNLSFLPRQIILPNPKEGDSLVVPIVDVIRIESAGAQSIFYFRWLDRIEKTLYSINLGSVYKKMLQGYDDFIIIHESHIINRNHITHYNSKAHTVKMADETYLRIATRRVSDFLEKFKTM